MNNILPPEIPHWEQLHTWMIDDIRFEIDQICKFKQMIREHPRLDDPIGNMLRDAMKFLKKSLDYEVKNYEKVYGDKPDVVAMRREVEKCQNKT